MKTGNLLQRKNLIFIFAEKNIDISFSAIYYMRNGMATAEGIYIIIHERRSPPGNMSLTTFLILTIN